MSVSVPAVPHQPCKPARQEHYTAPFVLQGLDAEAKGRADSGDVLALDALDDGGLPSIVEAPGVDKLVDAALRKAVNRLTGQGSLH